MRTITRSHAIGDLRRELLELVDAEHSLCLVASRRGIFCGGFGRWNDDELEQRLPWILHREPACTRAAAERQANRWMLGSQDARAGELPCDAGRRTSLCAGWDEFYEGELARYYLETCGEKVRVVPDGFAEAEDSVHRPAPV